jgi:hypothetical protein
MAKTFILKDASLNGGLLVQLLYASPDDRSHGYAPFVVLCRLPFERKRTAAVGF